MCEAHQPGKESRAFLQGGRDYGSTTQYAGS